MGRFEEALAACARWLEFDPRSVAAHTLRGTVLREMGCLEEALAALDRAIEIDPRDAEAHRERGHALEARGEVKAAIEAYLEAIRLGPADAAAHNNFGKLLLENGDIDGAIRECLETVRFDPGEWKAHLNLGNALLAAGDLQGAADAYREVIRLNPDYADSHYALANTLDELGDSEPAIEEFLAAIRLRPDYAEAHCNLGQLLTRQFRFSEALPWLRKGHELGSKRRAWNYPSGEWIKFAERGVKKEAHLERVVAGVEPPLNAVESIAIAGVLYMKSRYAECARMYAGAFAEDAALADDLAQHHRYNAACVAALAAAAGGTEAAQSRGQALAWLRADLAARVKTPSRLVATLEHWMQDPDLASVRDGLGDLPEAERAAWRDLWAAVDLAQAAARSARK